MGLLDKVDKKGDSKPVAKKATPTRAVAKKSTPKKAVAKKVKGDDPKPVAKPKVVKIRPSGLPEGFELAGKMPRYVGWLVNFAWNYGVLLGTISIFMFGDPDLTLPFLGAGLMIITNWLVIPIWQGRNIGEFVSRTKYINSSGSKPIFIHAVLNNSLGFLVLLGIIFLFVGWKDISTSSGATFVGIGAFFILLWIINGFFKRNSDYSQGIFDMAFSAYLVRHVALGTETGWLARFEGLGDFGDKWQQKQAERADKAAEKAAAKEAAAKEDAEPSEKSEEESTD